MYFLRDDVQLLRKENEVMFKGEIYNRADYSIQGADSEFVSELYQRYGMKGFANLRGSFVCALEANRSVVLIRDQFGTMPLYYHIKSDGSVIFGTTVKELLKVGAPRKLSRSGLFSYLSYGCVYTPYTLVEDVYSVPAGCAVIIHKDEIKIERYWNPSFEVRDWNSDELQDAISAELRRSLHEQTAHGAPAAFLSGGIDSSSIVALWRQQYDGEIRTYCVNHDDPSVNECKWARLVANRNHTKHTELVLEGGMIRDWLDEAVASYDQPSVDGLNFWFATRLLKETGEKTVLSGEGGDELFMGYGQFMKHRLAYRYAPYLRHMPRMFGAALDRLAPSEKFRKLAMLAGFKKEPYYVPRRILSDWQIAAMVQPDVLGGVHRLEDLELMKIPALPDDLLNRISWLEMQTVVVDMWMRDGFQTGAHNGISLKTPICDVKLAELLYMVPGALKCDKQISKHHLVKAAGDGMPPECVVRPKQGFAFPFDHYFSESIKERVDELLCGKDLRIFKQEAVVRMGRKYREGKIFWNRMWLFFMIENWCRENGVGV